LDLHRVALLLYYPAPYHLHLWHRLDGFPGGVAVFAEDMFRSTVVFAPQLAAVVCTAAAVAQITFVRAGAVAGLLLPNCDALLPWARPGWKGAWRAAAELPRAAAPGAWEGPWEAGPGVVLPSPHGAGPMFLAAGAAGGAAPGGWLARRRTALLPDFGEMERHSVGGCELYPLRFLARGLPPALVTPWDHPGLYNSTLDGDAAATAFATAMASHRMVVASGVFSTWSRVMEVLPADRRAQASCLTGGYAVAKVFEAMAAGAAVITETALVPHLASLGLREGVHYLTCEPTQAALRASLTHWLHSGEPEVEAALASIAAAGQAAVARRLQTGQQARALAAALTCLSPRQPQPRDRAPEAGGPELRDLQASGGPALASGPLLRPGPGLGPGPGRASDVLAHQGSRPVVDGVAAIAAVRHIVIRSGADPIFEATLDLVVAWVNRFKGPHGTAVLVPQEGLLAPERVLASLVGLGVDTRPGTTATLCINVGVSVQEWLLGVPYIVMEAEQPSGPFYLGMTFRVRVAAGGPPAASRWPPPQPPPPPSPPPPLPPCPFKPALCCPLG
jgi:hypothetical protein